MPPSYKELRVVTKVPKNPPFIRERMRGDGNDSITKEEIHRLADKVKMQWDNNPSFMSWSKKITGKRHLDDMSQAQLRKMKKAILEKTSGEDASRTAVIIKGNPDAPVLNSDVNRDAYYKRLEELLSGEGYDVRLDPGLPNTTPSPADVWLGHSR